MYDFPTENPRNRLGFGATRRIRTDDLPVLITVHLEEIGSLTSLMVETFRLLFRVFAFAWPFS